MSTKKSNRVPMKRLTLENCETINSTFVLLWYYDTKKSERHSAPLCLNHNCFRTFADQEKLNWKKYEIIRAAIGKTEYQAQIVFCGSFTECIKVESQLDYFLDSLENPDTDDVENWLKKNEAPAATTSLHTPTVPMSSASDGSRSDSDGSTAPRTKRRKTTKKKSSVHVPLAPQSSLPEAAADAGCSMSSSTPRQKINNEQRRLEILLQQRQLDTEDLTNSGIDNSNVRTSTASASTESDGTAKLLRAILSENKKQTKLLKKLCGDKVVANEEPEEMMLRDFSGNMFSLSDIPCMDPNKLAKIVCKKLFGENGFKTMVFEPGRECTIGISATPAQVLQLQKVLNARFASYSWANVKKSLNQAVRDDRKNAKKRQNNADAE